MNFDLYKNNLPYPKKSDFYFFYVYKGGSLQGKGTLLKNIAKDLIDYDETSYKLPKNALETEGFVIETVFLEKEYKQKKKEYREEENRLQDEFKKEVCALHGCKNDKVNEIVFSRSWSKGHSSGLSGVLLHFVDDIEFVEEIIEILQK